MLCQLRGLFSTMNQKQFIAFNIVVAAFYMPKYSHTEQCDNSLYWANITKMTG